MGRAGCHLHCGASQPVLNLENSFSTRKKCPLNAGFRYYQKSLYSRLSNFCGQNARKSPALIRKITVFWRLALETGE